MRGRSTAAPPPRRAPPRSAPPPSAPQRCSSPRPPPPPPPALRSPTRSALRLNRRLRRCCAAPCRCWCADPRNNRHRRSACGHSRSSWPPLRRPLARWPSAPSVRCDCAAVPACGSAWRTRARTRCTCCCATTRRRGRRLSTRCWSSMRLAMRTGRSNCSRARRASGRSCAPPSSATTRHWTRRLSALLRPRVSRRTNAIKRSARMSARVAKSCWHKIRRRRCHTSLARKVLAALRDNLQTIKCQVRKHRLRNQRRKGNHPRPRRPHHLRNLLRRNRNDVIGVVRARSDVDENVVRNVSCAERGR